MPHVYLGLGSNIGDRRDNLRRAVRLLQAQGRALLRLSPVVESPALLPPGSPADWNLPFLNLVVQLEIEGSPQHWQKCLKEVEAALANRNSASSWAPRAMDIDILLWGDQVVAEAGLKIPDENLLERNFALSPLVALQADLTVPGAGAKTVLQYSQSLPHHIPLWMGILNLTPDSFSDGGRFQAWDSIEAYIDTMIDAGVNIIDIGAESTRPGATPLTAAQEWARLQPVLERLHDKLADDPLRPWLSIDTYHAGVADKALALGADIINDVSGLTAPDMIALARTSGKDCIAMHHLTIPADSAVTLAQDRDSYTEVEQWLLQRMEDWDRAGLDFNRIIFDPGIGFGKNGLQSAELLRQAGRFRRHGLRVMIGHSRKSFLKNLSLQSQEEKDLATVGASLHLCRQHIDIIRVHNIPMHTAAYRGWVHAAA